MTANLLVSVALISLALTLRAEDKPAQLDAFGPKKVLDWDDPKWWEAMKHKSSAIALGKSDFAVSGPLVETFRVAPRSSAERNLGEKILKLPIVSLFVPQPMPVFRGEGKYFLWGERPLPWAAVGARSMLPPQGGLISVSH